MSTQLNPSLLVDQQVTTAIEVSVVVFVCCDMSVYLSLYLYLSVSVRCDYSLSMHTSCNVPSH